MCPKLIRVQIAVAQTSQSVSEHVKVCSSLCLPAPAYPSLVSLRMLIMLTTHPHPAHTTSREHTVFISDSASVALVIRSIPPHLYAFHPAIEASHDIAGAGCLLQVRAFDLVDLLLERGELLV